MWLQCFRSFSYVCLALSDSPKCDSEDQHKETNRDVEILTDWEEKRGKWFLAAFVDLFFYISFSANPEEHDACQSCAERADIDR